MKKSNAALRKPPAVVPVDPAAADMFVHGGGIDIQTSERPAMPAIHGNPTDGQAFSADVQTSRRPPQSKAVVERADGRTLRRMTVYLPTDLAKRLALYCTEHELDMSAVIAESVARTLGRSEG